MTTRPALAYCTGILIAAAPAFPREAPRTEGGFLVPRVAILWERAAAGADSVDQLALEEIFSVTGLGADRIGPGGLERGFDPRMSVLVVPHASSARMDARTARTIAALVERGCVLVSDGPGPLARALGIRTRRPERIGEVTDLLQPGLRIRWREGETGCVIAALPPGSRPVFEQARTHLPLGALLRQGNGRCLYIAPLVDPAGAGGYTRFPTLPLAITEGLGVRPPFSRRAAEAYFDPGYRFGVPPESLAHMWRAWGITCLHVAAWYASSAPPFDYRALLKALHEEGILAYAWLEWPYVGRGFWDRHPEWRQKNALLQDAHLDFLYLMDLQNPACMAGALGELEELLRLDWDGVDVAEFTLTGAGREALEGPAIPADFTGFTEGGRRGFALERGFDPIALFDSTSTHYWKNDTAALRDFYRYRTEVNVATERTLISRLRGIPGGPGELMLTIVDNARHPEFDDLLGFNMGETVALLNEFDVTLMVEDPYPEWSTPPVRYRSVRSYYRALLRGRPFLIDVNVVPMPEDRKGLFATEQPAGTEFLELWKYAAGEGDRACFYSESSVAPRDWRLLPFAMAAGTRTARSAGGLLVDAPRTVMLRGRGENLLIDGKACVAWNDSEIIIPAGRHMLSPMAHGKRAGPALRLTSITGELRDARASGDTLLVDYSGTGRCALGFDTVPRAFLVDGKEVLPAVYRRGAGCEVRLPAGVHRCTAIARGAGNHSPDGSPAVRRRSAR